MSVKPLDFSKPNLVRDFGEVKRMFKEDLVEGSRYLLQQFFHQIMADDLYGHIRARRYERTPVWGGYRNGYRDRYLLTSLGVLKLTVPRDREGNYQPDCFERYQRVERQVDEGIRAMYLKGVSTRKVGEVLDALCGERVSAGYVSKVTKSLDKQVATFRDRPLEDDFVFLFLDGLTLRVRLELSAIGGSVQTDGRLTAYGGMGGEKGRVMRMLVPQSAGRTFIRIISIYLIRLL